MCRANATEDRTILHTLAIPSSKREERPNGAAAPRSGRTTFSVSPGSTNCGTSHPLRREGGQHGHFHFHRRADDRGQAFAHHPIHPWMAAHHVLHAGRGYAYQRSVRRRTAAGRTTEEQGCGNRRAVERSDCVRCNRGRGDMSTADSIYNRENRCLG